MNATLSSSRLFRLAPLALALVMAACTVGPDFRPPSTAALPARFARADAGRESAAPDVAPVASAASASSGASVASAASGAGANPVPPAVAAVSGDAPAALDPPDAAFWRGFGDPVLSGLITAALASNPDLRVSIARYDEANALLRNARFDLFPTVTANAQIGHQLISRDQAYGAPRSERDTPSSGANLNASWELDLFGRVRRGVESQRAETAASAADLRAVRVAIAGDVAAAYLDLRGQQERLRIARENAANQRDTLRLIDTRFAAGRGSEFDAARQRAQYETTSSRVAVYEAAIGVDEHRLAVLTGQPPDALIARLDAPAPLPVVPAGIDPGTPAGLLRRRPDVAAAEARLHAATARVGVATADLFPRFTFSGFIGSLTNSYGVFREGSDQNLAMLGIDWSFLDIGRVRARIAQSDAQAAQQLAQYQQTVLGALEDTENALLRAARTRDEAAALERAAADSARAEQIARARFTAGSIGYFEVLDAQRSRLDAQDAAADSRTRGAAAVVALYKALAGGWPPDAANAAASVQRDAAANPGAEAAVNR
ncbi:efflux transporter outer membrane subunit [Burkholderia plantarii]|uniref:RND efflux transporter, outer membrane factor (OMF) lipoprotein, NodT family n=1 Tax=Burkholderia plantarii TaxID=41899 RepID=A0A0B6S1G8_BURPL|nr:TolC family protein [Burkholderia plantarii]AJK49498.1 RND efflux transporter, outer membrane factor (OMF) lipoprotein, NodT family [Burkholderia plantarii]